MSAPQRPGPPQPWQPQQQPYGPGQTEWIPRVQDQQPRRDEPFLFEEAPPEPPTSPAAVWAVRIAGLVAVALLSGFLWAYLQGDGGGGGGGETPGGGDPNAQDVPAGRFEFSAHEGMTEPKVDTDCAANSRDKVKRFFENNPCVKLTRALYTSTPPGQDKLVYTWVAVVEMDSPEQASRLYDLAHEDGSGNVTDPLLAGLVDVEGVGKYGLGTGGYFSQRNDSSVIIVESDWMPSEKRNQEENKFLEEVSADAVRLGLQVAGQG